MGIFDDFAKQYGGEDAPEEAAVNRVVQDLDDEEIDDELREAEKRLSKAAYYKVIVRDGVLQEDGTPEAAEINAEVKLWARKMMVKLLKGTDPDQPPPKVELPFNEKEILVLKKLVEKVLLAQGEKPVDPAVKTIQTAPKAPAVRKVPSNKPGPKNPPTAPAAAQPTSAAPKKKPFKPKKDDEGNIDYESIPTGEVFRDSDGHLYRFVPHPQEDNKRVKMKVTNQVRNPQALPMPTTKAAMEAITMSQAAETLNTGAAGNTIFPDEKGGADVFIAAAAGSIVKES